MGYVCCDRCAWSAFDLAMSAEDFGLEQDDQGLLTCRHCRIERARREYNREPEINHER